MLNGIALPVDINIFANSPGVNFLKFDEELIVTMNFLSGLLLAASISATNALAVFFCP